MAIFGFNRERAGKLRRIADREGLKPRDKAGVVYPADNASVSVWIGKADADINLDSSGTVSLWTGVPGSETDSGDNFDDCYNRIRDIVSGDWVQVVRINGYLYVSPLGCA